MKCIMRDAQCVREWEVGEMFPKLIMKVKVYLIQCLFDGGEWKLCHWLESLECVQFDGGRFPGIMTLTHISRHLYRSFEYLCQ